VENIIEIMAEEYFENKNLLPEHIELLEAKKYRINQEDIYALNFRIQNGDSFIDKYFKDDAVLLHLKDDSQRVACEPETGGLLKIYLNKGKMNELSGYLNNSENIIQNSLRDAMVKFYSLYHINLPSFHSYLSRNKKIDIPDLDDFEEMILKFKLFTSHMIYFWAKDLIQEGDTVNAICESIKFKAIDAETLKKFVNYLFDLKFKNVNDVIQHVFNDSAEVESVRLPLKQYPSEGKYAYHIFPAFSRNANVGNGKNVFQGKKLIHKTPSKFSGQKVPTVESYIMPETDKNISISNSGQMYVDVSFSMGNLFQNYLNSYFSDMFQMVLNRILNESDEVVMIMEGNMFLISEYYFSALRIQFEYLSGSIKLRDVVHHQKINLRVPFLINFKFKEEFSLCEPCVFDCDFTYKFDEELLNTPISDFLHPENFSVHVDLEFENIAENTGSSELHMIIQKRKHQ
jgi:hypothetical protein